MLKYLFTPALFMTNSGRWEKYQPSSLESFGDKFISSIALFWSFGLYASPIVATMLYRRGYMGLDGVIYLTKVSASLAIVMGTSYCIRCYGRASNPKYRQFVEKLNALGRGSRDNSLRDIKLYDFDFAYWPVEYEYNNSIGPDRASVSGSWRSTISSLIQSPCSIVGYIVLHTVGIRLIYPGSISVLNYILSSALMDGRKALVEDMQGERFKLKTGDGNYIDTMFVDKRDSPRIRRNIRLKGETLVICSEGNAGFYENGIMPTAIEAGFSVLGWNHPGFGCSTGTPYPDQEQNAMDTVMQFATQKLGFVPSNIILYGWSIGGYSTAWAANKYPVKAVVVDATFDDILPLALNQMPKMLDSIVRLTIRLYADLNVSRLLVEFDGPIKMVRRTQDEIICIEPGNIGTNRGNYLLKKLLKRRYPALFNQASESALQDWLDTCGPARDGLVTSLGVDRSETENLIKQYVVQNGDGFPFKWLGDGMDEIMTVKVLLGIAESYMVDYKSTHCMPLPSAIFQELTADNFTRLI